MRFRLVIVPVLVALALSPPAGFSEDTKKAGPSRIKSGAASKSASGLKKYDDVITDQAETQAGVFAVHELDDKLYFEIPADAFGKLMLWRAEVAKGPGGSSWGGAGLGDAVVRWERRGDKVYLWKVGFEKRSNGKAVQPAVEAASTDSIIAVFDIKAEGKDRAAVIEVTSMYLTGLQDLSVTRAAGGSGSVDTSRSYLDRVKAFPTNIEGRFPAHVPKQRGQPG